jgi:hypothetical protein
MPQEPDDFTIPLHHPTDMGVCPLKVYSELEGLWRMVDKYKMKTPISISVVNSSKACVRAIGGHHDRATGWQLHDDISVVPPLDRPEFPLTLRVRDAHGNILKMRLQLIAATSKAREGSVPSP